MIRQYKYKYDVLVHAVHLHQPLAADRLCFLWTRGSKTSITTERTGVPPQGKIEFGEKLSLICTLFRGPTGGAEASATYSEKLCSFALVTHDGGSDMRTLCVPA